MIVQKREIKKIDEYHGRKAYLIKFHKAEPKYFLWFKINDGNSYYTIGKNCKRHPTIKDAYIEVEETNIYYKRDRYSIRNETEVWENPFALVYLTKEREHIVCFNTEEELTDYVNTIISIMNSKDMKDDDYVRI